MAEGFDEHFARLAQIAARVPEAGIAAVSAGLTPIYEKANASVPVKTGALKASGQMTEPVASGGTVAGAVTYGSELVDYAVYVEFGTSNRNGKPYLTSAVMESVQELPAVMGAAFQEAMASA